MRLEELKPTPGSRQKRKRVGRGDGSGRGNQSGRGTKGQNARSGGGVRPGFEGGRTPLWMHFPKFGFKNYNRREYAWVNLDLLNKHYEDGDEVTPENLLERGIIANVRHGVKVLGRGVVDKRLKVKAHRFSRSAVAKIEAAGGQVEVI
ncbi:MAG: 50S ribosomal protein L15 [Candidatus Bipolaricaulia bacterium]